MSKKEETVVAKEVESSTPTQDENKVVMLGTISYTDENQYEEWLTNIDINQAIFVLVANANYSQSKGVLSLAESELISAAIRTIKKNSTPAPTPGESVDEQPAKKEVPTK